MPVPWWSSPAPWWTPPPLEHQHRLGKRLALAPPASLSESCRYPRSQSTYRRTFVGETFSLVDWFHVCSVKFLNLMKSEKSIQKKPSSACWGQSSLFRCGGQSGQSSDQGPVQEKRPQGFLNCNNLSQDAERRREFMGPLCSHMLGILWFCL